MGKLTLEIDSLNVESFETGDEQRGKGTVRGRDTIETEWCTGYPDCLSDECATPNATCFGTCKCTHTCS
jgi:hypothetical protein